jgi:hypothetical protein
MKKSDIRQSFYAFSGKVSDIVRQLGLAGIAIIWIFKIDEKGGASHLPHELYTPLYILCICLLFDLFQYLYGTIAWEIVLRKHNNTKDDHDINVSQKINYPTWICFGLKIVSLLIAYYFIMLFVMHKL